MSPIFEFEETKRIAEVLVSSRHFLLLITLTSGSQKSNYNFNWVVLWRTYEERKTPERKIRAKPKIPFSPTKNKINKKPERERKKKEKTPTEKISCHSWCAKDVEGGRGQMKSST